MIRTAVQMAQEIPCNDELKNAIRIVVKQENCFVSLHGPNRSNTKSHWAIHTMVRIIYSLCEKTKTHKM